MVTHTKRHQKSPPCIGCILELPPEWTRMGLTGDQKAIAILLIVENIKPLDKKHYDPVKAEESMRLMRQVLINRLKDPSSYRARDARTTTDIIRGTGQFRGFDNYPRTTDSDVYKAFQAVMHSNLPSVKNYIKMAIQIATLDENSIHASIPNVTGWMTAGSTPGGDFEPVTTLAGNTFFIDVPKDHSSKGKTTHKIKPTAHAKKHLHNKK